MPFLAIIAAALSGASAVAGGIAQKRALDQQAKVKQRQAEQREMEASEAIRRERRQNKELQAQSLARRAKSGVGLTSGSSLLVAAEEASRLELNVLDFARQAETERQGLIYESKSLKNQGSVAMSTGVLKGAASLFSEAVDSGAFSGSDVGESVPAVEESVSTMAAPTKKSSNLASLVDRISNY